MLLSQMQLFYGIEEAEIGELLRCLGAKKQTYRKGEIILEEGRPVEEIGIVLEGMVIVSCTDVWGNRSILGNAGQGTVFAEAYACIPGEPLRISVSASEAAEILFLNVGRMLETCSSACPFHTKLVRNLLTVCAGKSLELSQRILHTGPKSIRGRVLSYLSECVKKTGKYEFRIPYSRQELADYLSVDRSALSGELSRMQKEGLIQYHRNHFRVNEEIS